MLEITIYEMAKKLNLKVIGNDVNIRGFNLCNRKCETANTITYCTSEEYIQYVICNPNICAIILSQELYNKLDSNIKKQFTYLISEYPEWCFYNLYLKLYNDKYFDKELEDTDVSKVLIGGGTIIEKGVKIGINVKIGYNSIIKSGTIIGDNVEIGNCAVVGGDGFQVIKDCNGVNHTIPHAGGLYIGNNVFIGNQTSISRSLFEGFTQIGDNVKIDDNVKISHNCIIGNNCVLCAHSIFYGSCELKDNVWVAPGASIMNKIIVGEGALIGGASLVNRNVKAGSTVFGVPAKSK